MQYHGIESTRLFPAKLGVIALASIIFSGTAQAEEGWKIRYPTAGLLGPEMSLYDLQPGVIASFAVKNTDITALNGNDGNAAWTPPTTNAKGVSQTALADFKQNQTVVEMALGYIFPSTVMDGHVMVAVNAPYFMDIDRTLSFPQVTATSAKGVAVTPGAAYLASLKQQAAVNTISSEGMGDAEVNASWIYVKDKFKYSLGLAIVLPTGDFYAQPSGAAGTPAINTGAGKYFTYRPSATITYRATDDLTIGARGALAFNTTNTVDNWKSGNFAAIDLAVSYKTRYGVFGTQLITVKQYQDDTGGQSGNQPGGYGANRYESVGAGLFYAVKIKNVALTLGYTKNVRAVNALVANTATGRLTAAF